MTRIEHYSVWLCAIAAIVMLVLGTAVSVAWQAWNAQRNQQETAKIFNALQAAEPLPALENAAQDTRAGQAALANLTRASMMAQEGGYEQAANIYKSLFDSGSAPAPLDDLARPLYLRCAQTKMRGLPDPRSMPF